MPGRRRPPANLILTARARASPATGREERVADAGVDMGVDGIRPRCRRVARVALHTHNGYFATRGALPECRAGLVHYPGTYAAGCYNRLESTVAGRQVVNENLVNLPNWLLLRFRLRRAAGTWGRDSSPTRTPSWTTATSRICAAPSSPGPSVARATRRACSASSRPAWCTWGSASGRAANGLHGPRTGRERSRSKAHRPAGAAPACSSTTTGTSAAAR